LALSRQPNDEDHGSMGHQLSVIDRTVAKTNEWLDRLSQDMGTDDRERSFRILRSVLHALRDRVGPKVAVHLAAQLPLLVRGAFYEDWDPDSTPQKLTLDEFIVRVEREATLHSSAEAVTATRTVMQVLRSELSPGTMDHVLAVLPDEYSVVV
jgi:uncharacterized protein (DUF2267 family)